ncbi:MAG: methyltransferase domain-containing protein [Deltaproteobacteria bacterium]|nr:methyltransferase domain-containing protein [Deltaproteobacteria bacterium]
MSKIKSGTQGTVLKGLFDAQKIAFGPFVFQAVASMIELGILEQLNLSGEKGMTVEEIATKLNLTAYGVSVLLESGQGADVVAEKDGVYTLTNTGYFLLKDDLTIANFNFVKDVCYRGMEHLTASIKNSRPEGLKELSSSETIYEGLSALPEKVKKSWFDFDHYYSDIAFGKILPVIFKKDTKRILDIGGNTGKFTIQCAEYNDDVNITIADLPGQIGVARTNIEKLPFKERVNFHEVNLLKENAVLPLDMDAIWMSQFLDCFSPEEIKKILSLAISSLNKNGRIYIMETFWDNQRFEAASFCLQNTSLYFTAMANGNSKMYRLNHFTSIIEEAGLKVVDRIDQIGVSHTLLECTIK